MVQYMVDTHGLSQRQACKAVNLPRTTHQYKAKTRDDAPIIEELNKLVDKHPAIGFWQSYYGLRRAGFAWNHKRLYRVYTALNLNIRRRGKKRLPARVKQSLFQPERPNEVWSLDFMNDALWDGREVQATQCYR